jgi:hypothetical protein
MVRSSARIADSIRIWRVAYQADDGDRKESFRERHLALRIENSGGI